MSRILLTRPSDDAQSTASSLIAMGHTIIVSPLLEIRVRPGPPLDLHGVTAISATSANGVRALAARTSERGLTLFAVGDRTADEARKLGFVQVFSAHGDAEQLAELIVRTLSPARGAVLHPRSSDAGQRLEQILISNGFSVRPEVLYEIVSARSLSAEAITALRKRMLDAVLLYSPRTARTFRECASIAGLEMDCRALNAICISQRTAEQLKPIQFQNVLVAAHPNENEMLALVR